jgi:hypothetical protein
MRKPRRSDPISELPYVQPPRPLNDVADDDDDARSWIEHDEFGRPVDGGGPSFGTDGDRTSFGTDDGDDGHGDLYDANHRAAERERRARDLERQLEGGGSDSDSSLDLHTPLP